MHHCDCRMLSNARLRQKYCKCELVEGAARKERGPDLSLREGGDDFRAARGQSGHASTAATFECHQNNSGRFAGSAQIFAQVGSPLARASTCAKLGIAGEAHVEQVATLARWLLQPAARCPPNILYRLNGGGQCPHNSERRPTENDCMSCTSAAESDMKNRAVIRAKKYFLNKNTISAAKQPQQRSRGALVFPMRAPPRLNRLTSSDSSEQLSERSGKKAARRHFSGITNL